MSRTLLWASHVASFVAAKLMARTPGAVLVTCDLGDSEDADVRRFQDEATAWVGLDLVRIKSAKYANIDEVFEARKYHAGINGAPCTGEFKFAPRLDFQLPSDVHVFGYTANKRDKTRARNFAESYPEMDLVYPLIEKDLTKADCFGLLEAEGIRRPRVYDMGFPNGNCIGCVKASSPNYWALVRKEFPETFARRAEQSRRFGSRLTRINNVRIFIDEIPADWPTTEAIVPSCGFQCEFARQDIAEAA